MVAGRINVGGGNVKKYEYMSIFSNGDFFSQSLSRVEKDLQYIYAIDSNGILYKADKQLAILGDTSVTKPLSRGIKSMTADNDYVYVTSIRADIDALVSKLNKNTLTKVAESVSLGGGVSLSTTAIHCDDEFLYVVANSTKSTDFKIIKLNKNTLSIVAESVVFGQHTTIKLDGDIIYLVETNATGITSNMYILNKSTMASTKTKLGLATGGVATISVDNDFIYLGGKNAIVYKVNKETLNIVSQSEAVDSSSNKNIQFITHDERCIYVAILRLVIKLDKETLQELSRSTYLNNINGLVEDIDYLYVSTSSIEGSIVKISKVSYLVR